MRRNLLSVAHLRKRRGHADVVSDVNLHVHRGEAVALLGPNGAGKTTIFQIIIGFYKPDNGHIFLDDVDITQLSISERVRRGLNYLPRRVIASAHSDS